MSINLRVSPMQLSKLPLDLKYSQPFPFLCFSKLQIFLYSFSQPIVKCPWLTRSKVTSLTCAAKCHLAQRTPKTHKPIVNQCTVRLPSNRARNFCRSWAALQIVYQRLTWGLSWVKIGLKSCQLGSLSENDTWVYYVDFDSIQTT